MFVEYKKIEESSFSKFLTGNFVDLSELTKNYNNDGDNEIDTDTDKKKKQNKTQNNDKKEYIQLVGVSEYRITLFILIIVNDKIDKFVELVSLNFKTVQKNIEKVSKIDQVGNIFIDGILQIFQDINFGDKLYIYDELSKNFVHKQNFKNNHTYKSLQRKNGYYTKVLSLFNCFKKYQNF